MDGAAIMANPVKDLIDALGRQDVMDECGVTTQSVTNWIYRGRIPARHYPTFREMCGRKGVKLPEELFFGGQG